MSRMTIAYWIKEKSLQSSSSLTKKIVVILWITLTSCKGGAWKSKSYDLFINVGFESIIWRKYGFMKLFFYVLFI